MSHTHNDIHKEQIFEQASRALDDGARAINTLRDLAIAGDLDIYDYIEFTEALRLCLDGRVNEVVNGGDDD
jgi:hypothetical protein